MIIIGILLTLNITLISAQNDFKIYINDNRVDNRKSNLKNEVEISIYGTLYMIKNKPYNETLGLYVTFENIGSKPINVYLGFHLETISTLPWDYTYKTDYNGTINPNSVNGFFISTDFGKGLFFFTFFLEGTGEDVDHYYEKKATGICWNYFAFVLNVE